MIIIILQDYFLYDFLYFSYGFPKTNALKPLIASKLDNVIRNSKYYTRDIISKL